MTKPTLTAQDYQSALDAQSACNASGIIHSLSAVITKIWNEAHRDGHGTDWVNTHPIVRLYAEQISFLSSVNDYHHAYEDCQQGATALEPFTLDTAKEILSTQAEEEPRP